jgi:PAS domain S-box-containing protein
MCATKITQWSRLRRLFLSVGGKFAARGVAGALRRDRLSLGRAESFDAQPRHWEALPMSLRLKLVLPVAVCACLLLGWLALGWVPGTTVGGERTGVLVVVGIGLALLLVVESEIATTLVQRPLRVILHTFGRTPDDNEASGRPNAAGDEIELVRQALDCQHRKLEALGKVAEAAAEQRRQLEAALQYSEERYVLAMRISDDGPWEWNLQTNEFVLSPRWKCMLGYSDDEFPNTLQAWREHVHPLDIAALDTALKCRLDGQASRFEHQLRLLHKDGQYRWVSSLGTVIRHANGKALRIVALDADITRVKHIESVLTHIVEGTAGMGGEAFFRALVRHFAEALDVPCAFITECIGWPTTSVHTLAYWKRNDFRENIEFELAGTPCEAVVHTGRAVFHPSGVGQLFPRDREYESYYGIPIFGSRGEVIGHMAFFNDKAMKEEEFLTDAVYQIFTARAAAEIERNAALDRLARSDAGHLASANGGTGANGTAPHVTNV